MYDVQVQLNQIIAGAIRVNAPAMIRGPFFMSSIFDQDRRRQFLKQIKIESPDMLNLYCLMKSVDLHVRGDYDITKYGRLQRLKPESFEKESSDLKHAVLSVFQTVQDPSWLFKHSALAAIEFYLNGEPRASTCRKINYCPQNVSSYHLMGEGPFSWERDGCFTTKPSGEVEALSPLFENEVRYINNFKKLMSWYNNENGVVNYEFLRT